MSRSWVSPTDNRWVMYCDHCPTKSEPRKGRDSQPLEEYRDKGWFIAKVHGDRCPLCVAKAGGMAAIATEPFTRWDDRRLA